MVPLFLGKQQDTGLERIALKKLTAQANSKLSTFSNIDKCILLFWFATLLFFNAWLGESMSNDLKDIFHVYIFESQQNHAMVEQICHFWGSPWLVLILLQRLTQLCCLLPWKARIRRIQNVNKCLLLFYFLLLAPLGQSIWSVKETKSEWMFSLQFSESVIRNICQKILLEPNITLDS